MNKFLFSIFILLNFNSTSMANSNFTGESASDQILKQDIKKVISKTLTTWFGSSCRKIDSIQTQIFKIDQTPEGQIKEVIEYWTVSACNDSKTYYISLRPDTNGEVDFSVRLPPK